MKSSTIKFMQKSEKSFLVSIALSFLLAFSVAAYLSSPFTIRIQTVQAEAQELPAATTTPGIPFSYLNVVSFYEVVDDALTLATSTATSTEAVPVAVAPVKKASRPVAAAPVQIPKQKSQPVRLIIPAIGLSAPVEAVGLNSDGEMAVPDGNTSEVGWYKYGTIPGNVGSAVIDAHVFAAFQKLDALKAGSEVYVENADGKRLKFVVNNLQVYKLGELTSGMLFGKRDARRLNLITCAGEPTADGSTYTHRLVVYTTLVA